MAEEGKLKECSYFLVQYVPDIVRGEFVNIGLFLHSPEEEFLDCLFTDDLHRVRRLHPQADMELLRELQPHFEQQIQEHESDLEGFIREMRESYSNLIQVTEPRNCLLTDPQTQIHDLFARHVGARLSGPPPADTRMRIRQRLTNALRRQGVLGHKLFEKRIPAEQWTQKGDPFCFDFGYRPLQISGKPNGHIKLAHALPLGRGNEPVKALKWTFDRVLEREIADLTVGHEDIPDPMNAIVRSSQSILQHERIYMIPLARFDEYAESVRRELAV